MDFRFRQHKADCIQITCSKPAVFFCKSAVIFGHLLIGKPLSIYVSHMCSRLKFLGQLLDIKSAVAGKYRNAILLIISQRLYSCIFKRRPAAFVYVHRRFRHISQPKQLYSGSLKLTAHGIKLRRISCTVQQSYTHLIFVKKQLRCPV